MRKIIPLLFLCFSFSANAQQDQRYTDSLINEIHKSGEDTDKVNALLQLGFAYRITDVNEMIRYSNQAMSLAEVLGYEKGIAGAFNNFGLACLQKGNDTGALRNHFAALNIRKRISYKRGIGGSLCNIGMVYCAQKKYDKALKTLFEAKDTLEKINNKDFLANTLLAIGSVYYNKGKYRKAIDAYYLPAFDIYEKSGNKYGMVDVYINQVNTYISLNQPKDALRVANEGLVLSKEIRYTQAIKRLQDILHDLDKQSQ